MLKDVLFTSEEKWIQLSNNIDVVALLNREYHVVQFTVHSDQESSTQLLECIREPKPSTPLGFFVQI